MNEKRGHAMPKKTIPHPPEQAKAHERSELVGALEALGLLHEELILRRDEARDEAAREVYDEMLTLIDSLETEYRKRQTALPPVSAQHASYVFLIDEQGEIHPLPHRLYVALVRGEAATPQFAGKTLRLAEWYVRLEHGEPDTVVNETYALLTFDGEGRVHWSATPSFHPHRDSAVLASEAASLPSPSERDDMLALLFGAAIKAEGYDEHEGSKQLGKL
jgi:hypothetical protein